MLSDFVKTADWKSEKHVPVIECADVVKAGEMQAIEISVGKEIAHPNTTAHHIVWIALHFLPEGTTTSFEITRCEFSAHGAGVQGADQGPAYTDSCVTVKASFKTAGTLYATAYCNIHGLWMTQKAIAVE